MNGLQILGIIMASLPLMILFAVCLSSEEFQQEISKTLYKKLQKIFPKWF